MACSLFDILIKPKASVESFASTDLASHFIEVIGRDVCTFKRNNYASYCLVSRARDIRDQINILIRQVEADDWNDWNNYDLYTTLIDFLEDFLWEFVYVAESESQACLFPASTSLNDCLDDIESWAESRSKIKGFLSKIFSDEINLTVETSSVDCADWIEADDSTLLSALSTNINSFHPPSTRDYAFGAISDIKQDMKSIQSLFMVRQLNESSVVLVIRCAMLVNGVMLLCENVKEGEWNMSLASSVVWHGAAKLVSCTKFHIEGSVTLDNFQGEYEGFLASLTSPSSPPQSSSQQLSQPRAYDSGVGHFTQVQILIKQCRLLVGHIQIEGDKHAEHIRDVGDKSAKDILSLENALKDAIMALDAATKILPEITGFNGRETS